MEPIKPTFSEVVYSEMQTWLGRTPCKSCNTTVSFDVRDGLAVAAIKSMGRHVFVCVDLDWPEHRNESLGFDGRSTHPSRHLFPNGFSSAAYYVDGKGYATEIIGHQTDEMEGTQTPVGDIGGTGYEMESSLLRRTEVNLTPEGIQEFNSEMESSLLPIPGGEYHPFPYD